MKQVVPTMTDDAPVKDLRDQRFWDLWVGLLSRNDQHLVRDATVRYVDQEDTLVLLFPFSAQAQLGQDGFSRVVDAIRSFYDANRQQWIVGMPDLSRPGDPPTSAIMPRVVIEIAPPIERSH